VVGAANDIVNVAVLDYRQDRPEGLPPISIDIFFI
jgi:hypothetical protein